MSSRVMESTVGNSSRGAAASASAAVSLWGCASAFEPPVFEPSAAIIETAMHAIAAAGNSRRKV